MVTVASVWGVLLGAVAVVLAALPLVGLLGYESSFILGLLASLAAAQVAAVAVVARRERGPGAAGGPLQTTLALWGRSTVRALALLVVPLAVLCANALRVKNCALLEGLGWFALLPAVSVATGAAAGTAGGLVARTRGGGALAGTGLVAISLLWGLARFYGAPPVFAYDPFAGFFSGSLYDEAITIERSLVGARALHLCGALAGLLAVAALLDPARLRLSLQSALAPRRVALSAAAMVALFAFASVRRLARPVLAPTAEDIAAALGGRRDTEHLTILYSRSGLAGRSMDFFARDAEFRWSQLAATMGGTPRAPDGGPDGRITVFLFDSAEDKRRWLGAAHVQVAKPWRREVYLQWEPLPHSVIAHEMAHVFAGRFGDRLFGVARTGLQFNVGLIEGIAVAAGEHVVAGGQLLDQQVKAMRELGLEPRLDAVFGLGFLGEAPARAYTVAGSFVRYLLETQGPARFAEVYREGGSAQAWQRAYGRPFGDLAREWSRRIDAAVVDQRELAVIAERMRRPSILHKVCAHRLAEQRQQARRLGGAGDHQGALSVLASVCADDPDDPDPLLASMEEQALATSPQDGVQVAMRALQHPKASDGQKARALLFAADALLRLDIPGGQIAASRALEHYRAADTLQLDEETARQVRGRLLIFDGDTPEALRLPLARYLVGDTAQRDAALDLWRAQLVVDAAPQSGIGHYLLARRLVGHERFADAVIAFDRALELGLPPGGFERAARRIVAMAAFRAGDPSTPERFRSILARSGDDPAVAGEAADWVARWDYFRDHPAK